MSTERETDFDDLVEVIWQKQLASFDSGQLIPAEKFLEEYPNLLLHSESAVDIILNEYELLSRSPGQPVDQEQFIHRFSDFRTQLTKQFGLLNAFETLQLRSLDTVSDESTLSSSRVSDTKQRFCECEIIGRGSTAVVEKAYDKKLQQYVALKSLHGYLYSSGRARKRFYREAQAVSRLHHPNIVPIYDILNDNGEILLVSRFVDGKNLGELVVSEEAGAVDQIVQWVYQVADALHYAHENGVIHRDVKPSNIMISAKGKAMLTDFGLAAYSQSNAEITKSGELIGTPAFMSPESALGNTKDVDGRTDVYSLGATLYFLLTGHSPFDGAVSVVVRKILDEPPIKFESSLVDSNSDLVTIINKCMNKSPWERYASARDVADDLRRFERGEVIHAKRAGTLERVTKFIRRRPVGSAAFATILLLAMFLLGSLLQLGKVQEQRNRAQSAEIMNRELMAEAAVDAGRLSMKQGRLGLAVEHFQNGLLEGAVNEADVRLGLVDCYVSLRQYEDAANQLASVRSLDLNGRHRALVQYWQQELSATGYPGYAEQRFDGDLSYLSESKQQFLKGLDAETSMLAIGHFQRSVEADPHHHSARRMYLIMALSLARFDDVLEETAVALQFYPENVDFVLIQALALAALGELELAKNLVSQPWLEQEIDLQSWLGFCDFLASMTQPMVEQDFIDSNQIQWFAKMMTELEVNYLPLLTERNWRFPKRIGQLFAGLRIDGAVEEDRRIELRGSLREIVEVHEEALLLGILGECELIGAEPSDRGPVIKAQECFESATRCSAFLPLAHDSAWFGLYTTSTILALNLNHDVQRNKQFMLKAARRLDAQWLIYPRQMKTFVVPLFNMKEWELVKPFIDRWIKLARSDYQKEDAYWHLSVWHRYQEDWGQVLKYIKRFEQLIALDYQTRYNWEGLKNRATKELNAILGPNTSQ